MDEERWVSAIDGWKTTIASVAVMVSGIWGIADAGEFIDGTAGTLLLVVGAVFGVLRWFTDSKARIKSWLD